MKLHQHAHALASLDLANTALSAERPVEAIQHAMEAGRLDPASVPARLLVARIQLELQRPSDAITSLDAASHYDADDQHALDIAVLRAIAIVADGRDQDALPLLSELTDQCPADAHLHRLAAAACQRVGKTEAAIKHLQRVVALEPSDQAAARSLARLLAPHDPQASIDFIQPASRRGSAVDQWQATQWMRQAGRHRDAEENYRLLLATSPNDPPLWIEAGEHAQNIGSLDVAITRFMHAINTQGSHQASARAGLARAFMHAGRFEQAAWWWWKTTQCDRHDVDAWASLTVCGLCGDRPHLVDLAQKRLHQLADDDAAMFAMAEAWLHATTGDVIRSATEPARSHLPTASPLTWILQQSADVLTDQAAKKPGWADTLYHSAICEAALGEHEAARDHVQAALDINPNYKAAMTLAAQLPKAA